MNVSKKLIFAYILFISTQVNGQAGQKGGLDALAGQFIKYIRSDNKERIFVATDKIFYAAGETIWLKAWCLDSLSNRPIHKSKNLFLDLVDNRDSAVSQLLLNIEERKTGGSILLPGSLKEGYYWLRAYTKNILKEDSGRIFVRPVYILNASNPDAHALSAYIEKPVVDAEDTSAPQLLFFPEGGSLISGTTATVAFRCSSAKGKPIDVSGYITDTRNDTVARFKTSLPGTGKFSFDVYNPRKYFAHINWKSNRELTYPLPHINQFACQLSVLNQTAEAFHMRVSLGDSLYKKNKETYILGISRDSLCFAAKGADMYDVNIPKDNFPKGISTLFLFNDQNQIVSERAIYIDSNTTQVVAATDKPTYGAKEKVKLEIKVYGKDNLPRAASLSVSITDNRLTGKALGQDQLSGFFMDERGKQYSPEEIDLMMLTQKDLYPVWKFGDEHMIESSPNNPDSNLLSIKGKIVNKKNEPLKGFIVNLILKDKGIFKLDTTDGNGHFFIRMPDYEDGTQFSLKLTNLKGQGQEGTVILDKFDFPQFTTPKSLKKGFDKSLLVAIRNFKAHLLEDTSFYANENGLLKPVTVKKERQAPASYDVTKRVSNFSYIITADNFNKGDQNAIVNAIQRVPGFNAGFSTMSLGGSYGVQPLVIMDGVILSLSSDVASFLQTIEQTNIDFIEVLKGPEAASYGIQGAGGVILINTINKRKEVAQFNDKGLSTIYPKGYFKETGFPATDYDKKETIKSPIPDRRSTIYWNGNVLTDNNGKAAVDFFTADTKTSYTITVTGVTQNGFIFSKKLDIF